MLLQHNSGGHPGDIVSNQLATSLTERYQKPNLLKPFFLVFNILAYSAYIVTILAFSLSISAKDDEEGNDNWLSLFYRIVRGINGLCFFLLTVTLLNYGSRLEKIVHAIKMKGLSQQARQANDIQNYRNYGGSQNSSHNNTFNF